MEIKIARWLSMAASIVTIGTVFNSFKITMNDVSQIVTVVSATITYSLVIYMQWKITRKAEKQEKDINLILEALVLLEIHSSKLPKPENQTDREKVKWEDDRERLKSLIKALAISLNPPRYL